MGGVVAFEAARQLRAAGDAVELLALIDAPRAVRLPGGEDEAGFLEETLRDLLGGALPEGFSADEFRELDAGARMARLHAEAVRAGALPADLDAHRLAELLRVRRANLLALRSYQPGPFDGRALFLRAAERPAPSGGELRPLPWESLCAGGVEVAEVPGGHFTLLREPHVAEVARRLDQALGAE
jgi:thioesterase domain-containing protein